MRHTVFRIVATVTVTAGVTGCPKPESSTSSSGGGGQPGVAAHVVRGKEKRSLENDIRQLATMLYDAEAGRTPKSWNDFKPTLKQAPHIVKAVEEREIAIHYNIQLGSNVIIAYETQPDLRGSHVVAWGDGRVTTVSTADLDAALTSMGLKRQSG